VSSIQCARNLLEARVEREQQELRGALEVLGARARAELSLGFRVRARPLAWVAGAFLMGLWLGVRR
jgi:hypothetical protein